MFLSFEIEKELLIMIPIPALRITVKPALATTHLLKVVAQNRLSLNEGSLTGTGIVVTIIKN